MTVIFSFRQSLTFKEKMTSLKFKEKPTDLETRSYKFLLLSLVKLIHADPKLLLCVSIYYTILNYLFIVKFTFETTKWIKIKTTNLASRMLPNSFFSPVTMLLCFQRKKSKPKRNRKKFYGTRATQWKGEWSPVTPKGVGGGSGSRTRRKLK